MHKLPVNRRTLSVAAGAAVLLALPVVAGLAGEPYLVTLFGRILIYALAAVSLDLMLGFGGMVSLGHAAFFGIGAYVVCILSLHGLEGTPVFVWPFELGGHQSGLVLWPAAVFFSAASAAVIGALSLRTSGMHFIMITLAFAQMLYYFFVSLEAYGGDDGISLFSRNTFAGLDLADDTQFYYLCLAALAAFLFFSHRLVHSRFGMVIRGCRENERRMKSLGFPTFRYRLVCFVIAGAGAGLAGALIANQTEYVSPGLMHWTRSGEILVMVLLGGMGTLFGPVLGAATLLLMEEFLSVYTEHWMVYLGPFLIVVVLFAKRGIYGLIAGVNDNHG
ncbi:branched-chain amino acid ABC transporter permease [Desulfosarcina alkanivorans]|uniref:Branched-chain amino acid ABC transporter permease n=1 Tax=Desulfosarcina alkanivorans TaxID=571177 RepID=A0A5K7YN05_9BACT|nr:branched-chain amino acid ABC transporter permease [Desulfosarcina alkanivorans]BBO71152.1 branched-chain amino acid ABC transporter permease [Desulfosarcina alkanivorans]